MRRTFKSEVRQPRICCRTFKSEVRQNRRTFKSKVRHHRRHLHVHKRPAVLGSVVPCPALLCFATHCLSLPCIALHCIAFHCLTLPFLAVACVGPCIACTCLALHLLLPCRAQALKTHHTEHNLMTRIAASATCTPSTQHITTHQTHVADGTPPLHTPLSAGGAPTLLMFCSLRCASPGIGV